MDRSKGGEGDGLGVLRLDQLNHSAAADFTFNTIDRYRLLRKSLPFHQTQLAFFFQKLTSLRRE